MPFSVNNFRSQLTGGGARGNLFEVIMPFPGIANPGDASSKFTFMCKATSLPGSTLSAVEVPYFGRNVKLAGNRSFEEWSTTVINDEDFAVHAGIVNWMNIIQAHEDNLQTAGGTSDYQVDAQVNQYGKTGELIKSVNFYNMWPMTLAGIELSWDPADALEEFEVSWQYDWWSINDSKTETT
jgi:hypothetical protein